MRLATLSDRAYGCAVTLRQAANYPLAVVCALLWTVALVLAGVFALSVSAWDNRKIVLGLPIAATVYGVFVWWIFGGSK